MARSSRLSIVFAGLVITGLAGIIRAKAQCWLPCANGKCLLPCPPTPPSRPGGGGGGGYHPTYRAPGPTREEKQAYAYNERGRKAAKKGDWAAARDNYQQAAALQPGEPVYKRNLAYALNELGRELANQHEWGRAYDYFVDAANRVPGNPAYTKNRDTAWWWLREGPAYSYYGRGQDAWNKRDWAAAYRFFQQALALRPDNVVYKQDVEVAQQQLAYSYDELGREAGSKQDWAAASGYFQQALALRPDDVGHKGNLAYSYNELGREAWNKQDWAAASGYFQRALALQPNVAGYKANIELVEKRQQFELDQKRQEQVELDRQRKDAGAADAMRRALNDAVNSLPSGGGNSGSSSDGKTTNASGRPSGRPAFMGADSSSTFGTTSNPSNPDLHRDDTNLPGAGNNGMDQLKSMAGSSLVGQRQANNEASAVEEGRTPDQGLGRPEQAPVITVSTPPSQKVLSPRVAQAVAADKDYQDLEVRRIKAQREQAEAEQKLRVLDEKQKTEKDSRKRQDIQIEIANLTQQQQAAESSAATAQLQQEQIIQRYEGDPIIIPAPSQDKTNPAQNPKRPDRL